jgi:hypothetical protein
MLAGNVPARARAIAEALRSVANIWIGRWRSVSPLAPEPGDDPVFMTHRAWRLAAEDASAQDRLADRLQSTGSIDVQVRRGAILTGPALRSPAEEREEGLGGLRQHLVN